MLKYNGFTFIELLTVIAILGILLAVGLGWFTPNRIAVNQAAQVLASQFNRVRLEAIRNNTYAGLRVDATANSNRGAYSLWIDSNGTAVFDSTPSPTDQVLQTITLGPTTSGQQNDFARVKRVDTAAVGETNLSGFIFDSRGVPHAQSAGVVIISTLDGSYSQKVCVNNQGYAEIIAVSATCS